MAIETIQDHNGYVRKLGWVAPDSDKLKMRAGRTSIQALRQSMNLPALIPQSDWKPVDFFSDAAGFGKKFINNQVSSSGCVGGSGAQGIMRQRAIRGQEFIVLSWASLYAQINGGSDQGASIVDAMAALESTGISTEATMSYPDIFNIPAAAKAEMPRFKEDLAITITTFEEAVTALLMGLIPQFPIYVGSKFERFDGNGAAGLDRSNNGNHSVHAGGLEFVSGIWLLRMPNSWDVSWGPFGDGTCRLTSAHINDVADADDGFAHASTIFDPNATVQIPTPN